MPQERTQLSIGALSRATGVPTETLRTWERRYGFPVPARTDSGHRRYPMETVEKVKLITQLLQRGHRPSELLAAGERDLRALLTRAPLPRDGLSEPPGWPAGERTEADERTRALARWFEHVSRFEGRALDRELRSSWNELGARAFVEQRVAPFLTELGVRWERGDIGVRHEHFASERLREFLVAQWRPLSDAATGPTYVLATLPGERHVLGLHLVALIVGLAGGRAAFLGADTPPGEIAQASEHHGAEAVLLSAAAGCDPQRAGHDLARLRALLPLDVPVRVGGQGFAGVDPDRFTDLWSLERWLSERARTPRSSGPVPPDA